MQDITAWLGDVSLEEFRASYFGRVPLARPSTVRARELLDWAVVDEVLRSPHADVLVVARGSLLDDRPPRSVAELKCYLAHGIGLCIRHTEACHPGLRAIADRFSETLGPAQVQIFVTPGDNYGFSWHYDDEDVFIAHTAGAKEYFFRANTVSQCPARGRAFGAFARETSVLCAANLIAGDFLYLPSRWWHMAMCKSESISVSVGVRR